MHDQLSPLCLFVFAALLSVMNVTADSSVVMTSNGPVQGVATDSVRLSPFVPSVFYLIIYLMSFPSTPSTFITLYLFFTVFTLFTLYCPICPLNPCPDNLCLMAVSDGCV